MKRRGFVFEELFRLVSEYDEAMSAGDVKSDWNVDDALGTFLIRLNGETRRARKLQNAVKMDALIPS